MPLSINQIPTPVPSSTDPANFSARGDAVFGAFPNFITETNAVASEAAANRDLAEASKVAAAISETNAATYAANATTSANNASSSSTAPLWVSGTTYAINDKRVSPITGQVYRRKTAGAGTTDPSLDSTNWYAVLLDADTQYPSIKPTLNLDFANSGKLDPRITFTRASTATYYDGKTFAKAEENLLKYSQDFDNAAWEKVSVTVAANTATAPNGTATADLLVTANGSSGLWYLQQLSAVAVPAMFSIYAKANTANHIGVALGNSGVFAGVDLSTGTVTLQDSGYVVTAASIGGGWYRVTVAVAGGGDRARIFASTTPITVANQSVTGDGTSGIYIWGAQLEQRSQVTAYTPTTSQPITKYQPVLKTASNNEPRFDYDPVTLEAKGLLIEESRQNLALWNRDLTNAAWVKTGCSVLKDQVGLDGTVEASTITATANNATILQSITSTSAARITSAYIKRVSGIGTIQMTQNNGTTWTDITSSVGGDWSRVEIPSSTLANPIIGFRIVSNADAIAVDFVQHELGLFSTSAIATTSSAVTRQEDNAIMTGTNFSSWYNQNEGAFYAEAGSYSSPNITCICSATDGTLNKRIELWSGQNSHLYVFDSTPQVDLDAGRFIKNIFSKLSGTYKLNDFAVALDSGTVVLDTSGTLPVVNQFRIGVRGDASGNFLNGHIKKLCYYPKRLPSSQLQILTK